jgi:hypothetical protein
MVVGSGNRFDAHGRMHTLSKPGNSTFAKLADVIVE